MIAHFLYLLLVRLIIRYPCLLLVRVITYNLHVLLVRVMTQLPSTVIDESNKKLNYWYLILMRVITPYLLPFFVKVIIHSLFGESRSTLPFSLAHYVQYEYRERCNDIARFPSKSYNIKRRMKQRYTDVYGNI